MKDVYAILCLVLRNCATECSSRLQVSPGCIRCAEIHRLPSVIEFTELLGRRSGNHKPGDLEANFEGSSDYLC